METPKYQFVDSQLNPEQKQRVKDWVNTGSKNNPVGVYGASIELFLYAVQTGELPPYDAFGQIDFDWQRKLLRPGKHLYYATAVLPGIEQVDAPLARKIRKAFNDDQDLLDDVSLKHARWTSIGYANEMALTDAFIREFGVHRESYEIWAMTTFLFPHLAASSSEPRRFDPFFLDFKKDHLRKMGELKDKTLSLESFEHKLSGVIRRKGVLWYYNDKIFEHEVVPGFESEDEIMILPKRPLTLEVISGIEILGPEERKILLAS